MKPAAKAVKPAAKETEGPAAIPISPVAWRNAYDARKRRLAIELHDNWQISGGPPEGSTYPHDLPLVALLSFALCGELKPFPEVIMSGIAEDLEPLREIFEEGGMGESEDHKAIASVLWSLQRRAQVASVLVSRLEDMRQLAADEQTDTAKAGAK